MKTNSMIFISFVNIVSSFISAAEISFTKQDELCHLPRQMSGLTVGSNSDQNLFLKIYKSLEDVDSTSDREISTTTPFLEVTSSISRRITKVPYALGTNDFYTLVAKNNIFVDKSLFIKEYLELGDVAYLITRPKLWGKSINMNMLERFLQIEADEKGHRIPQNASVNRKLFTGGEITFEEDGIINNKTLVPLKISNQRDTVEKYQGKFPVISITFDGINESTYQMIENEIRHRVANLYRRHLYLREMITTDKYAKQTFDAYLKEESTTEQLQQSLSFLSLLLQQYYNKKVFILMDAFDQPINHLYFVLIEESKARNKVVHELPEFQKTFKLFNETIISSFQYNMNLEKGLITGMLPLPIGSTSSMYRNNITNFDVHSEQFSTMYGFTQSEVDDLVKMTPGADVEGIADMYSGYRYGNEVLLYNPCSIVNYLHHRKFDDYWLKSGRIELIDNELTSLWFEGKLKALHVKANIFIEHVKHVINFADFNTVNGFINIMLLSGYLIPTENSELCVPNEEVRHLYEKKYHRWFS